MILEKEILIWKNENGLTVEMVDVKKLPQSDFPRLIFQDFMNQLKIPKLKLSFELNTSQLVEEEPQDLENIDTTVRFDLMSKNTLNLNDVLMYYLLCRVLHTDFKISNIYTNNHSKAKLYFETVIPFSEEYNNDIDFVKNNVQKMKRKDIQHVLERFFVLLGQQYREKLVLFLTYLEQKYKFKLDKTAFVQSTLGEENLMRVEQDLNKIL